MKPSKNFKISNIVSIITYDECEHTNSFGQVQYIWFPEIKYTGVKGIFFDDQKEGFYYKYIGFDPELKTVESILKKCPGTYINGKKLMDRPYIAITFTNSKTIRFWRETLEEVNAESINIRNTNDYLDLSTETNFF